MEKVLNWNKNTHIMPTYPLVNAYLMWLLVVYTNTPFSSQAPLLTRMFSWIVHKHSNFRLQIATTVHKINKRKLHQSFAHKLKQPNYSADSFFFTLSPMVSLVYNSIFELVQVLFFTHHVFLKEPHGPCQQTTPHSAPCLLSQMPRTYRSTIILIQRWYKRQ